VGCYCCCCCCLHFLASASLAPGSASRRIRLSVDGQGERLVCLAGEAADCWPANELPALMLARPTVRASALWQRRDNIFAHVTLFEDERLRAAPCPSEQAEPADVRLPAPRYVSARAALSGQIAAWKHRRGASASNRMRLT